MLRLYLLIKPVMKLVLASLLMLASLAAIAQSSVHSTVNTEINDDDKTYSIRIDGDRNGKEIHYNRTFNVAGMSKTQKEAMKNRVLDSLGLGEGPPPPQPPTGTMTSGTTGTAKVTFVCPTCAGETMLLINGEGFTAERNLEIRPDKPGFPFELEMPPGTYQLTYLQNKVLQTQAPFTVKVGETNSIKVK